MALRSMYWWKLTKPLTLRTPAPKALRAGVEAVA